ncbi:hypothetical protein CD33_11125 [Ureibacillus sinduriensis BLB-1 = JCM 15800]|uniref:Uncharacterized protein n=1 Tax=Ureibacillus sinduriensis BLB-1 = JCM 15800 TaxID=1384057 RepID=A0A0A3HY41_9BACL|nr:hypothetical protein CD33_11125 [Ureibacillus sinduriensis BLB-1 = JCM 15800]
MGFFLSSLICLLVLVGCSDKEEDVAGEFLLGNFGFTPNENETYHIVVPIEWTGKEPVNIVSLELIKGEEEPITLEEDGISYEFFGADPLKTTGIYGDSDIGDLTNLKNLVIDGEGKLVLKLKTSKVQADNERRVKIKFSINSKEIEKIVKWKTLEQLTTKQQGN